MTRPCLSAWTRGLRILALAYVSLALAHDGHSQAPRVATQSDASLAKLDSEIARLARIAGGTVGVAAMHLETARAVSHNKGIGFPMASTFKVPVAVQLLSRVDKGEIRLDSMIALTQSDLHPGSGTLTELFDDPGVVLSLRNLLELMLIISDNSATDIVLRTAGGAGRVNERLYALGVTGVRVDRPTVDLIADWIGIRAYSTEGGIGQFDSLARAVPDSVQRKAATAFAADPRDTSTPEGMVRLLELVWRKQALSPERSALLLDIMRRCTTGAQRIKGMLPPETIVMHKTGTIGGTTNDVGIIKLPDDAGHVAIAVFVKGSSEEIPVRERAIAQISRAAYDYFLFAPQSPPARK